MEKNKTELKQALNTVTIIGTLKEKKLELSKTKDGKNYIGGELVIATDKSSSYRVHIFANKKTKDGKDSKIFKSYETINKSYLSEAEIIKEGIPDVEPTKVKATGELSLNDYYLNGQLFSRPQIRGRFINRVKSEKEFKPHASFDAEMYIENIRPELKKEEETGRAVVTGILPIYGGKVIPIDFITDSEDDITDFVTSNFEEGNTVEFWGDIINKIVSTTKRKKGFGKVNEEVVTTTQRELLITGGEPEPYEEGKAYNKDGIKRALAEREVMLEELKENSKNNKGNKNSSKQSFGSKRNDINDTDEDDEDIPF